MSSGGPDVKTTASQPQQAILKALDVKYNEIIDFLKSRQKLPADWQVTLRAVRAKVSQATPHLPDEAPFAAMKSGKFDGSDCKRVFDKLKELDGDDLNMLRQYKSSRVQTWYKLLSLYERDCIHVAEMATILAQNTTYEIPAGRKEIQRLQNLSTELQRKRSEQIRKSTAFRQEFVKTCTDLGLKCSMDATSEQIRQEILGLVAELASITDSIESQIQLPAVKAISDYYTAFVASVHRVSGDEASKRFPLLVHLRTHHNETVEAFCGHFGVTVSSPNVNVSAETVPAMIDIDWGDDDDDTAAAGNSDVPICLEVSEPPPATIEIDWGVEDDDVMGTSNIDISTTQDDWVSVEITDKQGQQHTPAVVEAPSPLVAIARDMSSENPKSNVLETSAARNQLVTELQELSVFLRQRLSELRDSDNHGLQMGLDIKGDSSEEVAAQVAIIKSILDLMNSPRTKQLFLIKQSPKYVERLASTLGQKLELAHRMEEAEKQTSIRQLEVEQSIKSQLPQIDALVSATKAIKSSIEEALSKVFAGMRVFVVGAVNEL